MAPTHKDNIKSIVLRLFYFYSSNIHINDLQGLLP